ncbi:MAG: hypothetical protein JW806_01770 [Sedimentisphaerales bacterium]|nr:hypothetical protein [Sedimentisphaerales bacterium]
MSAKQVVAVAFLSILLSISAGCGPAVKMGLNLAPQSEATYKVITKFGKDYSFVQPSINKTKERHTAVVLETVFVQNVESIDAEGNITAKITIKDIKYFTEDADGQKGMFDSYSDDLESNPVFKMLGKSYEVKLTPNGQVIGVDVAEAKESVTGDDFARRFCDKFLSEKEVRTRHQVLALMNAGQKLYKKGDKWSVVVPGPEGMLRPKSFEKTYTLTDVKTQGEDEIAVVDMVAVTSSKRADGVAEDDAKMNFFSKMFDETDHYTGQMKLNLTTGQIDSYQESLKAEWVAIEPSSKQPSDKGPDQLTMSLWRMYSIEKVE